MEGLVVKGLFEKDSILGDMVVESLVEKDLVVEGLVLKDSNVGDSRTQSLETWL